MDRRLPRRRWTLADQVVCLLLCACALDRVLAQIRYSVPEELEHGAFVGNIAEDLGLDVAKLSSRRFRIHRLAHLLVAIIVLAAVKCYKDRDSLGGYALSSLGAACCSFEPEPPAEVFKKSNLNLQISTGAKVPTNCVEVNSNPGNLSQAYCYKVCLTPESAKSDFMFLKPCSPGTPRNNAARGADNLALSSQSRCSSVNNGATTPNELKQANTDWALTKNQTSSLKSCNSINMDGTLMRKAMQAEPENYMGQMAAGQYWTWGTRSREYRMHSPAGSVSQRAWTPHYTPQHNPTHHLQQTAAAAAAAAAHSTGPSTPSAGLPAQRLHPWDAIWLLHPAAQLPQ
ncbi:hypothetical protein QQF64_006810 [Cirrhinus molitorella]|uniref:Uncharacterized protein n=1 Tax=Cirrhinus molitorella TaxID=172907 RepID=A0ABR3M8W7_9TELE